MIPCVLELVGSLLGGESSTVFSYIYSLFIILTNVKIHTNKVMYYSVFTILTSV
jgi:hypothetical protein